MSVENLLEFYTNAAQIHTSIYEVALTFGLSDPDSGEVIPRVRVRMSPQQALALSMLLEKHIRAYGDKFQEIFLPDDLVTSLRGEQGESQPAREEAKNATE